jgi:transposase-like protein
MTLIDVRQRQYLNDILTQDHRAMTCVTRRVMEFKVVEAALRTLAEIEVMPTIK